MSFCISVHLFCLTFLWFCLRLSSSPLGRLFEQILQKEHTCVVKCVVYVWGGGCNIFLHKQLMQGEERIVVDSCRYTQLFFPRKLFDI